MIFYIVMVNNMLIFSGHVSFHRSTCLHISVPVHTSAESISFELFPTHWDGMSAGMERWRMNELCVCVCVCVSLCVCISLPSFSSTVWAPVATHHLTTPLVFSTSSGISQEKSAIAGQQTYSHGLDVSVQFKYSPAAGVLNQSQPSLFDSSNHLPAFCLCCHWMQASCHSAGLDPRVRGWGSELRSSCAINLLSQTCKGCRCFNSFRVLEGEQLYNSAKNDMFWAVLSQIDTRAAVDLSPLDGQQHIKRILVFINYSRLIKYV